MSSQTVFVTPLWLSDHLHRQDIAIVDASWYLPAQNRNADAEYEAGHIPGAIRFDIDAISDRTSALPHMLPTQDDFSTAVSELGISDDMTIIVYDGAGLFSAARVWWTFRVFGAKKVFVLEGGFPAWKAAGLAIESGRVEKLPATFSAAFDKSQVAGIDAVATAAETGVATVVDARAADRFRGEAPEPRPGLRSGHIPGSRNVPFAKLVANGTLVDPDTIRKIFEEAGVDLDHPIVTSCGSGVSAAVLALALASIDRPVAGLYDGSWSEWGARLDKPIATGEP
jgi:thiosulfate/3-mercaptopyruvate sulfurtransferase